MVDYRTYLFSDHEETKLEVFTQILERILKSFGRIEGVPDFVVEAMWTHHTSSEILARFYALSLMKHGVEMISRRTTLTLFADFKESADVRLIFIHDNVSNSEEVIVETLPSKLHLFAPDYLICTEGKFG